MTIVDTLEQDHAAGLFDNLEPPCLSLYQPTHRHHPDNQQDPIRFKNLVKELETSLLQSYTTREIEPLLAPFLALADDRRFWNHTLDGLAVLGSKDLFRYYRLQRPVPELAVAADSLHTKPLMRILQSADRFQVLGLSRGAMRLFEGNRDVLDEIELGEGMPATITDALGEELTEPHLKVASYGGVGGRSSAMHHGHGGKAEEVDSDAERYFRAVDRAVLERHSQPAQLPLILAALPEHHHLFHQVSRNPLLIKDSIDINPDALGIDELRQRAWQVMEPYYLERLGGFVSAFGTARANGTGDADLVQVARAAVAGRVATLLIEAERTVPGRIDPATGEIAWGDMNHPEVDDVLDDLAALASGAGAEIVIVPTERMPTDTGIAAIYRF